MMERKKALSIITLCLLSFVGGMLFENKIPSCWSYALSGLVFGFLLFGSLFLIKFLREKNANNRVSY